MTGSLHSISNPEWIMSGGNEEILKNIFQNIPLEEDESPENPIKNNLTFMRVCKTWHRVAGEVAKQQMVQLFKNETEEKAKAFLKMVPGKLEDYCAAYKRAISLTPHQLQKLTPRQLLDTLRNIPEYHDVIISRFFTVDPNDPDIQEELFGKSFAELHYVTSIAPKYYDPSSESQQLTQICIWGESTPYHFTDSNYLPVELFNLTVQGANHEVVGDKDHGTVSFILRGRLVELNIIEGNEDIYQAQFYTPSATNRQTAPLINPSEHYTIPYAAKFDAAPRSTDLVEYECVGPLLWEMFTSIEHKRAIMAAIKSGGELPSDI